MSRNVDLRIGVIGCGNGGSQIAENAYFAGYQTMVMNTSAKDLYTVIEKDIPSILISPDGRGTGKSRDISKSSFKSNLEGVYKDTRFFNLVEENDVVVVIGTLGGGTGSGMGPFLCERIRHYWKSKNVIFYGILPRMTESMQAQFNMLEAIDELVKLKLPFMLADLDKFRDVDDRTAHKKIADHVLKTLNILRGDMVFESKDGMLDERDMLSIINKDGYIGVYYVDGITSAQLANSSLSSLLLKEINNGPNAAIQNDKIIDYLGIMVSAPEEFNDPLLKGDYGEITAKIGTPIDIFYNPHINDSAEASVSMIASGMSIPASRLKPAREMLVEFEKGRKKKDLSYDLDFKTFGKSTMSDDKVGKLMTRNTKAEVDLLDDIPDFL